MVNQERVLIVGALGQVGRELIYQLSNKHGVENVIVSDLKHSDNIDNKQITLNVMDYDAFKGIVIEEKITQVYNLAALLSATADTLKKYFGQVQLPFLAQIHLRKTHLNTPLLNLIQFTE